MTCLHELRPARGEEEEFGLVGEIQRLPVKQDFPNPFRNRRSTGLAQKTDLALRRETIDQQPRLCRLSAEIHPFKSQKHM